MKRRKRKPLLVQVLHADADLLVIDKPPGLVCVPGQRARSVREALEAQGILAEDDELRPVHRIDRHASGVVAYARNIDAQRKLTAQFVSRTVEKVYLALAKGHVQSAGEVDLPLKTDKSHRRVVVAGKDGKPSLTRYLVMERLAGHTLLECRPRTGRLHQIRVHLSAIGHALGVDPLYGGEKEICLSHYKAGYRPDARWGERPLIRRLTLHAWRLTVRHPRTDEEVTFEAPVPKDLRATIRQLGLVKPSTESAKAR